MEEKKEIKYVHQICKKLAKINLITSSGCEEMLQTGSGFRNEIVKRNYIRHLRFVSLSLALSHTHTGRVVCKEGVSGCLLCGECVLCATCWGKVLGWVTPAIRMFILLLSFSLLHQIHTSRNMLCFKINQSDFEEKQNGIQVGKRNKRQTAKNHKNYAAGVAASQSLPNLGKSAEAADVRDNDYVNAKHI